MKTERCKTSMRKRVRHRPITNSTCSQNIIHVTVRSSKRCHFIPILHSHRSFENEDASTESSGLNSRSIRSNRTEDKLATTMDSINNKQTNINRKKKEIMFESSYNFYLGFLFVLENTEHDV